MQISTHFPESRALIIGAGIAGPVAAMALQQADIRSVIYEAGLPATGEAGPYVTVAANGLNALAAIGIDSLKTAGGFATRATAFFDSSGRHLGTTATDKDNLTFRLSRLQRLLQGEAANRGIPFEFGKQLTAATMVPRGLVAHFADGSRAEGEMLIGCDGVHSVVRRMIDPAAPAPRDAGVRNFCGYTSSINAGMPGRWQMIYGHRAFFSHAVDPSGGTVWFASVARASIASEGAITGHDEWKRTLIALFEGDAGPAIPLIEAGVLDVTAGHAYDLAHVPRWHRGPLIVIGDAAHATLPASGQGASLAIEDGVLLAKHLRQLPTEPAFDAFERARRERVERVVAQGASSNRRQTPGPGRRMLRDLTLPIRFCYGAAERSRDWMHDHHVDWHQPIVNT